MSSAERRWLHDWGMVPIRLVVGLVFLMHGGQKLFVFGLAGVADMLQKLGFVAPTAFALLLIAAEVVGSLAVLLGVFSRIAGLGLAVEMAIAIYVARLGGGFFTPYGYEFELTLLGACLTIAAVGPGSISLERLWRPPAGAAASGP
jgi:putative oxidoreductase